MLSGLDTIKPIISGILQANENYKLYKYILLRNNRKFSNKIYEILEVDFINYKSSDYSISRTIINLQFVIC